VIPLAQVFAVRALRNVVFVRGAEVGVTGTVLSAAILLLPFCLVAGYTLTLACSILNRCGDASGAGRVYVADSLAVLLAVRCSASCWCGFSTTSRCSPCRLC